MNICDIQDSGQIELYFYGELPPSEGARVELHIRGCGECAGALAELRLIREALAAKLLRACELRRGELVVPWSARIIFTLMQTSPTLADWLVRKLT